MDKQFSVLANDEILDRQKLERLTATYNQYGIPAFHGDMLLDEFTAWCLRNWYLEHRDWFQEFSKTHSLRDSLHRFKESTTFAPPSYFLNKTIQVNVPIHVSMPMFASDLDPNGKYIIIWSDLSYRSMSSAICYWVHQHELDAVRAFTKARVLATQLQHFYKLGFSTQLVNIENEIGTFTPDIQDLLYPLYLSVGEKPPFKYHRGGATMIATDLSQWNREIRPCLDRIDRSEYITGQTGMLSGRPGAMRRAGTLMRSSPPMYVSEQLNRNEWPCVFFHDPKIAFRVKLALETPPLILDIP